MVLSSDKCFTMGDFIWFKLEQNSLPVIGKVSTKINGKFIVNDEDDKEYVIDSNSVIRVVEGNELKNVEDMINLNNLQEYTILRNICLRYKELNIYTYIGWILIAVNPYQPLSIYSKTNINRYADKRIGDLPPHIYAISNQSYIQLQLSRQNQCIIVSGESGSGKTESTKILLQFLTSVSGKNSLISKDIIDSIPVLEAFGNATTVKNYNSSRFGKFIEIFFNDDWSMSGACVQHYLLERSRIKFQNKDDRNYHIFYCLLNGLSRNEKKLFHLDDEMEFSYLNQIEKSDNNFMLSRKYFEELKNSMENLKFTTDEYNEIFKFLSCILLIGNINFTPVFIDNMEGVNVVDDNIDDIADLLSCTKQLLLDALTKKTIIVENIKVISQISIDHANNNRDGFSMSFYGQIFSFVLKKINKTISKNKITRQFSIGILDIFGFENFSKNSFEQLCINFTNEYLQQFFVVHIFKIEQEEYKKEEIEWTDLNYSDNFSILNLIGLKSSSLLMLIDEQTKVPKGDDLGFLVKANQLFSKHPNYIFSNAFELRKEFGVRHYAGDVIYNVEGFIEKNHHNLGVNWLNLVKNSSNSFLKEIFIKQLASLKSTSISLSVQYKKSLDLLMKTLQKCNPFFIRCIKPNENKTPFSFDHSLCSRQLKYFGLMETVKIRCAGFPVRFSYEQFIIRYKVLLHSKSGNVKKDSQIICQKYLTGNDFKFGLTKLFLKYDHESLLNTEKDKLLIKCAVLIQKNYRRFFLRKKYFKIRSSILLIQKIWRGYIPRRNYQLTKLGFQRFQARIRSRELVRQFSQIRQKMIKFQAHCRGFVVRKNIKLKVISFPNSATLSNDSKKLQKLDSTDMDSWITNVFKDAIDEDFKENKEQDNRFNDVIRDAKKENISNQYKSALTFSQYAAANFTGNIGCKFTNKILEQSLLDLQAPGDQMASLAIWITLLRFMGDISVHVKKNSSTESIMKELCVTLPRHFVNSKQYTEALKILQEEELASSNLNEKEKKLINLTLAHRTKLNAEVLRAKLEGQALKTSYDKWVNNGSSMLQKLHFIIGHGILRPALRDEIYCQLCKQLTDNPSTPSIISGWIVMSLCVGCFPPSVKFSSTLINFIVSNGNKLDSYGRLQRTMLNGCRQQPPSSLELSALKTKEPIILDIQLADNATLYVEADSATTSNEIVNKICNRVNLTDTFGFSLFITIFGEILSLENGNYKVMDAICQCEQTARTKGLPESRAPWSLMFRKEIFAPWQPLINDPIANHLIYQQIIQGITFGEYRCSHVLEKEPELARIVAQHYYITCGENLYPDIMTNILHEIIPEKLQKLKGGQYWVRAVNNCFKNSNFVKEQLNEDQVKLDVTIYAKNNWPLLLSKYYEVQQVSGIHLETTSMLLAVNSVGIFLTKNTSEILLKIPYINIISCEIVKDKNNEGTDCLKILTVENYDFIFATPVAEIIYDLILWILDELAENSLFALAVTDYLPPDESFLQLKRGDLIQLMDQRNNEVDWLNGCNIKTGEIGEFPKKVVIKLPVLEAPPRYILGLILKFNTNEIKRNTDFRKKELIHHTLEKYSTLYFRAPKLLTQSQRGWNRITKSEYKELLWKYSSANIKLPLMENLVQHENNELAVLMFNNLLMYMSKKFDNLCGVLEIPLQHKTLRNEFYCQLLKQLTDNPNMESEKLGWDLFWILVGLFPCKSEILAKEIRLFLTTRPNKLTQEILYRYEAISIQGERKSLPHWMELDKIKKNIPMRHKIIFHDGIEHIFEIDSFMKVKDLVKEICRWLGFNSNTEGFSLAIVINGNTVPFSEEDFIFDSIQDPIFKDTIKAKHFYEILFIRTNWKTTIPGDDKRADAVCHYYQELEKYLGGFFSCKISESIYLAILHLQAKGINTENDLKQAIAYNLNSIIPVNLIHNLKESDWMRNIQKEFDSHPILMPTDAKIEFLTNISKLPMFGSLYFNIKQGYDKEILAINRTGLILYDSKSKNITSMLPYSQINDVSYNFNSLRVIVRDLEIVWECEFSKNVANTIKMYLDEIN